MTQIISKRTQANQPLTITYANGVFVAHLAGSEVARSPEPGYRKAGGVHVFGDKIGLTFAEGDLLRNTYHQHLATLPQPLTREDLVAAYQVLCGEQNEAYERAHAREDARAMSIRIGYDEKIEAAYGAIQQWDAAHPGVTSEPLRMEEGRDY